MSSLINTAISGIRLNQTALSVTGHNIVNANTEGYSRQSVSQSTTIALRTSAGYLGTGVQVDDITRHTEKFLVDQVVQDIGTLSDYDTYLFNISQTNNLLASEQTSLSRAMNDYFDALNEAVNDPGSLLGRQLLLSQTQQMVASFDSVESRMLEQNSSVNKQMQAAAGAVSSLGQQIAELNQVIADSQGGGSSQNPNDLLDERDTLIRELSKYVNVNTISREDGGLDVFIGQNQPLVVGADTQTLVAAPGTLDSSRFELYFRKGGELQNITRQMAGGELGALVRFRNEALDPALNSLGQIGLAITDGINQQNQLGMDLEGSLGNPIFKDINDAVVARDRVKADSRNAPPNNKDMSITIDDISALTTSDYELTFPGPGGQQYSIVRKSDGEVMEKGMLSNARPQEISIDGFTLSIDQGTFSAGDRFLLQPTRTGVGQMQVQITRPEEFAFASPIRIDSASGNQGGAEVLSSQVISTDTSLFDNNGSFNPPLAIRFTSASTYDVLDYSNPANPVQMDPPLTNLRFVPGAQNALLPSDPGGTTVRSDSAVTGVLQIGATDNAYPGETITVETTDPATGFITQQSVTTDAAEEASVTARRLSALDGVSTTAYTQTSLQDFTTGAPGEPLQLSLNGEDLTDPNFVLPGEAVAQDVPVPLTADFLRDRINGNADLAALGITAKSDGVKLSVFASTGIDLKFSVDGGGSLTVGDDADLVTAPLPADPATDLTIGGKIDVQLAANTVLSSDQPAGLFGASPTAQSNFLGVQINMTSGSGADGQPSAGDTFTINYNTNGSADNRNGAAMLALGSAPMLSGGNLTVQDAYGQLAEKLGILTSQARVNQSASESMLRQSMDAMQSVSGVNLEEEAARLIQLEQHYNASARLIGLARELFDTLLNM
ncbi:MAG: flagellar hook-associated protein FlgK [Pseudohongiella sp.]|uniref:flagellar hook-associated protein FlgK n=1 Tax=Pseudohongiella sp. TaxID=1979412 RepID=UPI00349FFCC2